MKRIAKMLGEPSTWAGMAAMAGIFSANPLIPAAIMKAGAAFGAVLAIVLPETGA